MPDIEDECPVVALERKPKASGSADCEYLSLVPRCPGFVS